MNHHFHTYFNSFKLKTEFWTSFIVEALTVTLLTLFIYGFARLLELRAYTISGGRSVEELKTALLTGSLESNQIFLHNIQVFTYLFIVGGILTLLITLFVFSFAQASIWNGLIHSQFTSKKYWKWNSLNLCLLFLSVLYVLVYVLLRIVLNLVFASLPAAAFTIITNFITFSFLLGFFLIMYLAYYSFVKNYQVWLSMGNAFHLLKTKWNSLWRFYLLTVATAILLSVLISLLRRLFPVQPQWMAMLISVGTFLLLLSWIRLYLIQTLSHEPHQSHSS